MSKTVKPNWPDEVRLKMIEKSEFYSEPQVYQYGFYDGFQHAQSQTQELTEQNRELVEMLERAKLEFEQFRDAFGQGSLLINEIEKLILKHDKQ